MEGFTVALALVDFIPVAAFGAAGLLAGLMLLSRLFLLGAALSTLAGILKAGWKLILGICKKDIKWMNKSFVPLQASGFLLMIIACIIKLIRKGLASAAVLTALPQGIFFLMYFALMVVMSVYRKKCFRHDDAKSNWTAQIINCCTQLCFLAAVLCIYKVY